MSIQANQLTKARSFRGCNRDSTDLTSVALLPWELGLLLSRPPVEVKAYLMLRALAVGGVLKGAADRVSYTVTDKMIYLRLHGDQLRCYNWQGDSVASKGYDWKAPIAAFRNALKKLENDGLVATEREGSFVVVRFPFLEGQVDE